MGHPQHQFGSSLQDQGVTVDPLQSIPPKHGRNCDDLRYPWYRNEKRPGECDRIADLCLKREMTGAIAADRAGWHQQGGEVDRVIADSPPESIHSQTGDQAAV